MTAKFLPAVVVVALGLGSAATVSAGAPTAAQSRAANVTAGPSAHAARAMHRFRGTVTARNQAHGWFRMHTTRNQRVRIWTTRSTHWDDCDWGDMSYGHHVDVRAYRSHGRWMASAMYNWHDWNDWDHMMGR